MPINEMEGGPYIPIGPEGEGQGPTMFELGAFPMGNNGLPLVVNFEERMRYRHGDYFEAYGLPKPLDSLYDKVFYGRVDRVQNAIVPRRRDPRLFGQLSAKGNHTAFDFVANAFLKLRRNLKIAREHGGIDSNNTVFYDIEATAGMRNYTTMYETAIGTLIGRYEEHLFTLPQKEFNKILTFQDYLNGLYSFLKRGNYIFPITLTEFVLSPLGDPLISGIVVTTAADDYGNDYNKYITYMKDINFAYYVRAARKYGFYVDKNAPWRLFADVLSTPMKEERTEAASEHSSGILVDRTFSGLDPLAPPITPTLTLLSATPSPSPSPPPISDAFFNRYYDRTYLADLHFLKTYLVKAWNAFVVENPTITETIPGTLRCPVSTVSVVGNRYTVSLAEAHQLGHRYWFEYFIRIREHETGVKYGDHKEILDTSMKIIHAYGYSNALQYLNNLFKPYLYDERFFVNNPLTEKK